MQGKSNNKVDQNTQNYTQCEKQIPPIFDLYDESPHFKANFSKFNNGILF